VAKYREIVESSATTATANVIAQQQLTSSAVDVTVPIPAAVVSSNKGAKTGTNEIAVQLVFYSYYGLYFNIYIFINIHFFKLNNLYQVYLLLDLPPSALH
jgi:hypothetical protein